MCGPTQAYVRRLGVGRLSDVIECEVMTWTIGPGAFANGRTRTTQSERRGRHGGRRPADDEDAEADVALKRLQRTAQRTTRTAFGEGVL